MKIVHQGCFEVISLLNEANLRLVVFKPTALFLKFNLFYSIFIKALLSQNHHTKNIICITKICYLYLAAVMKPV